MALSAGIAVVSRDKPDVLRATLEQLALLPPTVPLVIVDNGSTDPATLDILTWVEQGPRPNAVIRNPTNLGLSVAVNQGLAILDQRFGVDALLHFDDDALMLGPTDWLPRLIAPLDACPELGLAIPMVTRESIPRGPYAEVRWGLGFCWAIRRDAYRQIGGYDPQLLHQQECDLAIRVRMCGYTVGAIDGIRVHHNDPGGPKSVLAMAREHIGVVQFRDKWVNYLRGPSKNYGSFPVYLMNHWPLDQDWYERFAKHHGIDLNPYPPRTVKGEAILDASNSITVNGVTYFKRFWIVQDGAHWETMEDAHSNDRLLAIERWFELTGERYVNYAWPERMPWQLPT